MIRSEHTLKGNTDICFFVKEFLSTLESATFWLDIREYYLSQPVSYSFACHVS